MDNLDETIDLKVTVAFRNELICKKCEVFQGLMSKFIKDLAGMYLLFFFLNSDESQNLCELLRKKGQNDILFLMLFLFMVIRHFFVAGERKKY